MTTRVDTSASEMATRAISGDREAFGAVVRRYQALVSGVCYSMTGDLGLSEDLAQETFLVAWRRMAELREPGKAAAWLCGIARNVSLNARRKRRPSISLQAQAAGAGETAHPSPTPVERAVTREEAARLWSALEEIPEGYRESLVLYYRDGRSLAGVAAALDISEDAAKQRLSRGRRLLRREMEGFVEEALARSAPSALLAAAVVAAVSAGAPGGGAAVAGAAGAAGAAAQSGAETVKHALGALAWLVIVLSLPIAIIRDIRSAKSARERRFVVKSHVVILILAMLAAVAAFGAGLYFMRHSRPDTYTSVPLPVLMLFPFLVLMPVGAYLRRKRRAIQVAEGTYFRRAVSARVAVGAVVVAALLTLWVVPLALAARDTAGVLFLVALVVLMPVSGMYMYKKGQSAAAVLRQIALYTGSAVLLILGSHWDKWTAAGAKGLLSMFAGVHAAVPMTAVAAAAAAVVVGTLTIGRRMRDRA